MSISMFYINSANDSQKKYNIPFMTEALFKRVVLPASIRAKAQIIPLFETGFELRLSDADALLTELKQTRANIEASVSQDSAGAIERIDRLMSEIGQVFRNHPDAEMYIG